ncbi:MAG: TraM recognition domain-containing protein [Planctomycetales bacterium]|nr:TraM recognition domain-containing protein [Planctomycetales bacterium]
MFRDSFRIPVGNPVQLDRLPKMKLPFEFPSQADTRAGFRKALKRLLITLLLIDGGALVTRYCMRMELDSYFASLATLLLPVVPLAIFIAATTVTANAATMFLGILACGFIVVTTAFLGLVYPVSSYILMAVLPTLFVIQFGRHWIDRCTVSPLDSTIATQERIVRRRQLYLYAMIPLLAGFAAYRMSNPLVLVFVVCLVGTMNIALVAYLTKCSPLRIALVAMTSWCGYGHAGLAPGIWQSPVGDFVQRNRLLLLSTLTFTAAFEVGLFQANIAPSLLSLLTLPAIFFAATPLFVSPMILVNAQRLRRSVSTTNPWRTIVRSLRQSENPTIRQAYYNGQVASDGMPLLVDRSVKNEHAHILGGTGGNKTSKGVCPMLEQSIGFGDESVVVIDLKGDSNELLAAKYAAARELKQRTGQMMPLKYFSTENDRSTYGIKLLDNEVWTSLTVSEQTDLICSALGVDHGTDYGAGYFSAANSAVVQAALTEDERNVVVLVQGILSSSPIRSISELAERTRQLLESGRDSGLSQEIMKAGRHVYEELKRVACYPQLSLQGTGPEADAAIDLASLYQTPQLLYVHLPTMISSRSAPIVGRLLIRMLLAAAAKTNRKCRVKIFIDEFQRLSAQSLDYLFQMARSLDTSIVVSNQSLEDLKSLKSSLISTIEANCQYRQWFDIGNQEDLDRVLRWAGQTVEMTSSRMISANGNESRTETETILPRMSVNEINLTGSDNDLSIVQIGKDRGYAPFGRFPFVVRSDYHISAEEYQQRRKFPWPSGDAGTFVPRDFTQPTLAETPPPRPSVVVVEVDGETSDDDHGRADSDAINDFFSRQDEAMNERSIDTDDSSDASSNETDPSRESAEKDESDE